MSSKGKNNEPYHSSYVLNASCLYPKLINPWKQSWWIWETTSTLENRSWPAILFRIMGWQVKAHFQEPKYKAEKKKKKKKMPITMIVEN